MLIRVAVKMVVWVATFAWFVSFILLPFLVIFWQVIKVIAKRAEKRSM